MNHLNITTATKLIISICEINRSNNAADIDPDTKIKGVLLDSLEFLELIHDLEFKYGIKFNDDELTYPLTVGDLSNLIDKEVNAAKQSK